MFSLLENVVMCNMENIDDNHLDIISCGRKPVFDLDYYDNMNYDN
ncbi:hypothetical protein UT300012_22010 [Paraclostridium bifermentans]